MNATSRRAGAASLLFPAAYRRKVLSLLLLNPERRLLAGFQKRVILGM